MKMSKKKPMAFIILSVDLFHMRTIVIIDSIFLAIVENMTEFRPILCVDACKQGLLACLLKRLKVESFLTH
jgi:hypothetical protein